MILKAIPKLLRLDLKDPINKGLLVWLSMQDNGGIIARDISGNNNYGTLTNMDPPNDWIGGKNGYALNFDNNDDYTVINGTSFIQSKGSIAFSFCPSWNSGDSTNHLIFGAGDAGGNYIRCQHWSSNDWYIGWTTGWSSYRVVIPVANMSIVAGTWYNFLLTWDDVTNETYVYLDGQLKGSKTDALVTSALVGSFYLATWEGTNVFYGGSINNFRIWNRALTPQESFKIHSQPWVGLWTPKPSKHFIYKPTQTFTTQCRRGLSLKTRKFIPKLLRLDPRDSINEGLVGWWPMQDRGGAIAWDVSGYGNHGILTNMDPATDWVAGQNGYALNVDGSNEYVLTGIGQLPVGAAKRSFAMWVRATSTFNGFCLNYGTTGTGTQVYLGQYNLGGGTKTIVGIGGAGSNVVGNTAINDSRWHLLGFAYDGTNLEIWLDGKSDGSAVKSPNTGTTGCRLGSALDNNQSWIGDLANARFWSSILTSGDWNRIYSEPWAGLWTPKTKTFFYQPYATRIMVV